MENETESNSDVVIAKLISGGCLFLVSVLCGVVPFKLAKVFKWTEPLDQHNPNKEKKSSMTVNILLCFGGGVLLATTFLHLLPGIFSFLHFSLRAFTGIIEQKSTTRLLG